jgi:hypothetical protein
MKNLVKTILILEDNDERIAALSAGRESIPEEWLKARETIQV